MEFRSEQIEARENIIKEMLNRLQTKFPDHEVKRGVLGAETNDFPSIFVFADVERITKVKRGLYERELPLVIDYLFKASSAETAMQEGNEKYLNIVVGVEKDEYFNNGTKNTCIKYGITELDIIPYHDRIVDVSITYQFRYKDFFLGS
jgi:hypothetical protein